MSANKNNSACGNTAHIKEKLPMIDQNSVRFPSLRGADKVYRISSHHVEGGVNLIVENKRSHEKWQCSVNNFADHGPDIQMPASAFLNNLALAFEINSVNYAKAPEVDDPSVDMETEDGGMLLTLTLRVSRFWKPAYTFSMVPVALEALDTLSAQVRDIQEELAELKSERAYMSVASKTACSPGQAVTWNGDNPHLSEHFALSQDLKGIVVKMAGLYCVHARFTCRNVNSSQFTTLTLDGNVVAKYASSDQHGQYITFSMTKIMPVHDNGVFALISGANHASVVDPLANEITIYEI